VADFNLDDEDVVVRGPPFLEKVGGTYLSGVGGAAYFERSIPAVVCFEATLDALAFVTGCLFCRWPLGSPLLSMERAAAAADDEFPEPFGFTMRGFLGTAALTLVVEAEGGGGGLAEEEEGVDFGGEGGASSESR